MTNTLMPPYDESAERATLGSLLIDPVMIAEISAKLSADDFYLDHHRWIYEAILRMGESADLVTIEHELERQGKLAEAGGLAYLAGLTDEVVTALNVSRYADIVLSTSLRRRLSVAAQEILRRAYDTRQDDAKVIDAAQASLMKAIRSNNASKGITKSSAIEEWRDGFDALLEGNTLPGISTKIPEFDQKIGGLKPGKLYVFAGKSGTGKTTLMLNLLIAAAKTGHACVLFSGEMTEVELVEVCCAILAFTRYRQVNFNEGHIVKLDSKARTDLRSAAGWATVELERLPLYLRCIPGMTPTQLRYECKAMKQQYGIELVAVDYIQIMQSGLNGRDVNREREIAYITEELKRMAMDNGLRLPLLAGSQVNAEGDLRESKAIGHHADVVVFLNSEGDGKLKATFQKNRRGPTGDVDLYFKRESSVIGSIGK